MPPAPSHAATRDAATAPSGIARRRVLRGAVKATLGAGLALPFLGRRAQAAATWTLFSQQANPSSAVTRGLRRLSDLVRDRTGGALLINVRTAGMLPIDANQVLESVATGRVELGDDTGHGSAVQPSTVMRLPLLATSPGEWDQVSKIVRPMLAGELEKRGIVLLAHYRSAMQLFWSRQKAGSFADIARQRLRVQSVEQAEFLRLYGGLHVITSTVEAGEALQAGKLQGIFGTAAEAGRTWRALLKHVYLAGPNYNDAVIVAGRDAMSRLPEGVAPVLLAAAADTAAWIARTQDSEELQQIRVLAAEGLKVTPADSSEILEGMARIPSYWDSWVRLRGGETENLLAAIRQALDR